MALLAAGALGQGERFRDDRAVAKEHGWVLDYGEAKRQARETNRPIMLVFRCVP